MHHYRSDETDLLQGNGAPSSYADRATGYIDNATGTLYINSGGGSTWTARAGLGSTRTLSASGTAVTLTQADSGKTIFLAHATGAAITLPANSLTGFTCRFICSVAPTTSWDITAATADTVIGSVYEATGAASDTETTAGGDTIRFVATTAVIGDQVDVIIDGTNVLVRGFCSAAGGIIIQG